MIDNVCFVLGIEMMISAQALDSRNYPSSPVVEAVRSKVRETVAFLQKDRIITDDINNMKQLIEGTTLTDVVQEYCTLR
jgi:histidine ammonia-lyase